MILRGQLLGYALISYCEVSRPGMGDLLQKVSRKDRSKFAQFAGSIGKANLNAWRAEKVSSNEEEDNDNLDKLSTEELEALINSSAS